MLTDSETVLTDSGTTLTESETVLTDSETMLTEYKSGLFSKRKNRVYTDFWTVPTKSYIGTKF